jgi:hypothetical protein
VNQSGHDFLRPHFDWSTWKCNWRSCSVGFPRTSFWVSPVTRFLPPRATKRNHNLNAWSHGFYSGSRGDVLEGMITPFCDGCGKPISANQNFCFNCGRALQPFYPQPSLPPQPTRTVIPPPAAPPSYPTPESREVPLPEPQRPFAPPAEPVMPQPMLTPPELGIQRPTGVAVLSILMFLGGAVDIGTAALFLFLGTVTLPTLALLPSLQLAGTLLLLLSIIPLIFAVISFVLGFGLWKGRSWAWTWTLISSIIGLIVSAAGLIIGFGLVGVVIYAFFIFYLTRGRVKSYFGKGTTPAGSEALPAGLSWRPSPYSKYDQATPRNRPNSGVG